MSEFFEEDDDLLDTEDEFVDANIDTEGVELTYPKQDARRRLESMLEEKRLRDELDDFVDF